MKVYSITIGWGENAPFFRLGREVWPEERVTGEIRKIYDNNYCVIDTDGKLICEIINQPITVQFIEDENYERYYRKRNC